MTNENPVPLKASWKVNEENKNWVPSAFKGKLGKRNEE